MNPIASLALKALPWVAVFILGAAAAEAYEHKAPWGLKAQRNAALVDLGETRLAASLWKKNRDGWKEYADRLEADRDDKNDEAVDKVTSYSADSRAAAARGFENGYNAGRVAGRKLCGAADAKPDAAGAGQLDPGGLRDDGETLAGRWADRAYRPAGAVPGHD